jgi:hypothetical protein
MGRRSGALYSPPESYTNCGCNVECRVRGYFIPEKSIVQKRGAACAAPELSGLQCVSAYFPVPDNGTTVGLFVAELSIVRVPVRNPVAVGVNVTLSSQLPFATRATPQCLPVVARAKSPVVVMLLKNTVMLSLLVRVTILGPLVSPTGILVGQTRLVGETVRPLPPPLGLTVRLTVVL